MFDRDTLVKMVKREPDKKQKTAISRSYFSNFKQGKLLGGAWFHQTFAEVTDPVAWQREMRQYRPLPGREG